jgi:hypothetical protein
LRIGDVLRASFTGAFTPSLLMGKKQDNDATEKLKSIWRDKCLHEDYNYQVLRKRIKEGMMFHFIGRE